MRRAFLAPVVVGAVLLPWQSVRREGLALIAGPFMVIATYFVMWLGIAVGAIAGALITSI